jgi:hypothetical protein
MKQEWKDWFIQNRDIKQEHKKFDDREYKFTNFYFKDVPFHEELKQHIYSLNAITKNTVYDLYHVHTWEEGFYFGEHIDNNFRRVWSYVCELQESECKTTLLAEGNEMKEGIFTNTTKHEVPKIQKGIRISLTVFGSTPNQLL